MFHWVLGCRIIQEHIRGHCSQCLGQMKQTEERKMHIALFEGKQSMHMLFPKVFWWSNLLRARRRCSWNIWIHTRASAMVSSTAQKPYFWVVNGADIRKGTYSITVLFTKEIILLGSGLLAGRERPSWLYVNWHKDIKESEYQGSTMSLCVPPYRLTTRERSWQFTGFWIHSTTDFICTRNDWSLNLPIDS